MSCSDCSRAETRSKTLYVRAVEELSLHPDCAGGTTHNRHIWKCGVLIKILLYGEHYNTIQDRGIHYWYGPGQLNRYQSTVGGKKSIWQKTDVANWVKKAFSPTECEKNKNITIGKLKIKTHSGTNWTDCRHNIQTERHHQRHRLAQRDDFHPDPASVCWHLAGPRTSAVSNNRLNLNNALGKPLGQPRPSLSASSPPGFF